MLGTDAVLLLRAGTGVKADKAWFMIYCSSMYCVQEKISTTFLCAIMTRRACNAPSTPEHYSKKFGKVFDQIVRGEDLSKVTKFHQKLQNSPMTTALRCKST